MLGRGAHVMLIDDPFASMDEALSEATRKRVWDWYTAYLKLTRFRGHRNICVQETTMAKTRPPYTPEFRRQMVELVRAGRSPEELGRVFEPTAQSIKNWVAQAERDAGRGDGGLSLISTNVPHSGVVIARCGPPNMKRPCAARRAPCGRRFWDGRRDQTIDPLKETDSVATAWYIVQMLFF